ncbi:DUF7620 family protein [Nonomuraea rhodomycinica]|uniref:Uncharacterized protein n=1 Tax=Nonomuraea rhodomycinica TaxID=1712872 RepID=A0A7Y6IW95_9ACTN|nr:hypothetical protein [Nonomuraea rhodomycinica]NUW45532.1 hypothetical protein [Nonomuraea rhodomycinica]
MTDEPREDEHPDIDDAKHAVQQSRERAEQELRQARERARRMLGLADRLRRLREENGFHQLFEEAFGGRG